MRFGVQPSGDFSDSMPDILATAALMAVDTGEFQGFLVPVLFVFDPGSDCVNTCTSVGIIGGTDRTQVCTPPGN